MSKFKVQLVTPERSVLAEEADSISVLTSEGYITILPGHVPLVANLVSGEMTLKNGNKDHILHVAGGFIQVKSNSEVILLADQAEHFEEIDLDRAEQAKLAAEAALKEQTLSDEEYATTAALLQRNLSRINIVRKHSHRKTRITSEGVFHSND